MYNQYQQQPGGAPPGQNPPPGGFQQPGGAPPPQGQGPPGYGQPGAGAPPPAGGMGQPSTSNSKLILYNSTPTIDATRLDYAETNKNSQY